MVQLPQKVEYEETDSLPYSSLLGNYERGVCYAAFNKCRLKLWGLVESTEGRLCWTLTHEADLSSHELSLWNKWVTLHRQKKRQWEAVSSKTQVSLFQKSVIKEMVQDGSDYQGGITSGVEEHDEEEHEEDEQEEEEQNNDDDDDDDDKDDDGDDDDDDDDDDNEDDWSTDEDDCSECSWNSDKHNFIKVDESSDHWSTDEFPFKIIGLHPYKEVLILQYQGGKIVSYHLDTSRMQYLCARHVIETLQQGCGVDTAFPYRPCYDDKLPHL